VLCRFFYWTSVGLALSACANVSGLADYSKIHCTDGCEDGGSDTGLLDDVQAAADAGMGQVVTSDAPAAEGGCGFAPACTDGAICQEGVCTVLASDAGGGDARADSAGAEAGCTQVMVPPSVNVDATQWVATYKTAPTWNCSAAGTTTIDSMAGTVAGDTCGGTASLDATNNVAQSGTGGPSVLVIRLGGLTVTNGHVIQIQGNSPIVFLVSGNVLVDSGGKIDAGAKGATAGSGGDIAANCNGSSGKNGTTGANGHGGGGGGFGTAGGAGGSNSGSGGSVSAGNLQPLRGGCGGGSANNPGGAGGGAFEISASGTITIGTGTNAAILSAEGGGSPGTSGGSDLASGGGGSGGGILLVSPALATFGSSGASRVHGGASGGASANTTAGEDGHTADNTMAAGGTSSDGCGATGATGGLCAGNTCSAASAAGASGAHGCGGGNSGGGGGGGQIQVITGMATMSCL
jgi:hypothetical protein